MTNDQIVARAQAIAARDGSDWADHLIAARRETQLAPLQKLVKSDRRTETLRKRALLNQQRHLVHGTGSIDPDRRLELGEVSTSLGRVRVAIERDSIQIHGVSTMLADLDRDLQGALVASAAAFSAAATDLEQTDQRTLIGLVIDGVLRRNEWLTAKIKEALTRQRYGV